MASAYDGQEKPKNLESIPTYRVAFVVFIFVAASLVFEKGLHHLGMAMKRRKKKGLYKAVEVVKDELMLLGFISLILTIFQGTIAGQCVRESQGYDWLPCTAAQIQRLRAQYGGNTTSAAMPSSPAARHLFAYYGQGQCHAGEEPFMTYDAMHYIHYFIFILAIVMVVFSSLVFVLSFSRIHMWKNREDYAQGYATEVEQMTLEERLRWAGLKEHRTILYAVDDQECCPTLKFWLASFAMLFIRSVHRENYLSLRMLFITKHNLGMRFNFHEYLTRSLEEDFAHLVGLTIPMWGILIGIILTNVAGADLYLWSQVASIIFLMIVGTHLLGIMRTLTRESAKGTGHFLAMDPRPTDALFWFSKPSLVRHSLHFILFLNSLDMSAMIFYWWKFGLDSCLLGEEQKSITRVSFSILISVIILYLSAFVVLPIYALVSQMGSNYHGKLFSENMEKALSGWVKAARNRGKAAGTSSTPASTHDESEVVGAETVQTPVAQQRQRENSVLLPPQVHRSLSKIDV